MLVLFVSNNSLSGAMPGALEMESKGMQGMRFVSASIKTLIIST